MASILKINIQTGINHRLRFLPHPLSVFAEKPKHDFSVTALRARDGMGYLFDLRGILALIEE